MLTLGLGYCIGGAAKENELSNVKVQTTLNADTVRRRQQKRGNFKGECASKRTKKSLSDEPKSLVLSHLNHNHLKEKSS